MPKSDKKLVSGSESLQRLKLYSLSDNKGLNFKEDNLSQSKLIFFTIPTYIYNTDIAYNNITIHVIQSLLTLPLNKTKQTIMSSLLVIPALHYTKATNHGHRTTTTKKCSKE